MSPSGLAAAAERMSWFQTVGSNFPSRTFAFQPIALAASAAAAAGIAQPGADWLHERIQTVLPCAAGGAELGSAPSVPAYALVRKPCAPLADELSVELAFELDAVAASLLLL